MPLASEDSRLPMACAPAAAPPTGPGTPAESGGRFSVVCGGVAWGVLGSLEEAIAVVAEAFEAGLLPARTPVSVSALAEYPRVRIEADPRFFSLLRAEEPDPGR